MSCIQLFRLLAEKNVRLSQVNHLVQDNPELEQVLKDSIDVHGKISTNAIRKVIAEMFSDAEVEEKKKI